MAELDERLSRLLSDGDSMKQVIELASAFMSGQKGSSSQTQEQYNNCGEKHINLKVKCEFLTALIGK